MKGKNTKKVVIFAVAVVVSIAIMIPLLYYYLPPIDEIKNGENVDNRLLLSYTQYHDFIYKQGEQLLPFRLKYPQNIEKNKRYPLLIYLHGDGAQGNDNKKQMSSAFLRGYEKYGENCYVLLPQAKVGSKWNDYNYNDYSYMLNNCLDDCLYPHCQIDRNRLYIVGVSMGGWGVAHQIMGDYDKYSAAIIVSGGSDDADFAKWKNIPLWVAHGALDNIVPVHYARDLVGGIRRVGGAKVKYTEYPNLKHHIDSSFFANKEVWRWLFSQGK